MKMIEVHKFAHSLINWITFELSNIWPLIIMFMKKEPVYNYKLGEWNLLHIPVMGKCKMIKIVFLFFP